MSKGTGTPPVPPPVFGAMNSVLPIHGRVWKVMPEAPRTLAATGLSLDLVTQLALKTLRFADDLDGAELAARLGLLWPVVEPAMEGLKSQRQVEVVGGSLLGGVTYRYRITDAGRNRAALSLKSNAYVGAAPVPLSVYRAYIEEFARTVPHSATPRRLRTTFSHMVLPESVLDQIGPAINAGSSLFIYGDAGNGKTQIARGIRDVLDEDIAIPHAIEVEGQVVRVFDPFTHEEAAAATPPQAPTLARRDRADDPLDLGSQPDRRWVRCKRPVVVAGGELSMDSLMLRRSAGGCYKGPLQLLANGGILVIDDFGRQRCSTTELLNRWIAPLESRVDYLTLGTGQSFEVPFRALIVFATNLRPQELVDEAFLRRIHAKVRIAAPTRHEFTAIFEQYCATVDVPYFPWHVNHLLDGYYRTHQQPMRGCHPRDLISHALLLAEYRGEPRGLTPELLDAACHVYFVRDESPDDHDPAAG